MQKAEEEVTYLQSRNYVSCLERVPNLGRIHRDWRGLFEPLRQLRVHGHNRVHDRALEREVITICFERARHLLLESPPSEVVECVLQDAIQVGGEVPASKPVRTADGGECGRSQAGRCYA